MLTPSKLLLKRTLMILLAIEAGVNFNALIGAYLARALNINKFPELWKVFSREFWSYAVDDTDGWSLPPPIIDIAFNHIPKGLGEFWREESVEVEVKPSNEIRL